MIKVPYRPCSLITQRGIIVRHKLLDKANFFFLICCSNDFNEHFFHAPIKIVIMSTKAENHFWYHYDACKNNHYSVFIKEVQSLGGIAMSTLCGSDHKRKHLFSLITAHTFYKSIHNAGNQGLLVLEKTH